MFHVKLTFDCRASGLFPTRTLTQVLSQIPAGESVAIRITDLTHSKQYSYQALHALPSAIVAEQLPQMGASTGQALMWDGTKWWPDSVGTGNGSVTTVNTGTGLTGGPISTSGTISIANLGVGTAELANNAVTAAKINAGEITNSHISATAAIDYSKLNIGVGEIPQDRINGLSSAMTSLIEDVINDAETGKAPSQNAVYDALGFKADRSNITQSITAVTVTGLTGPIAGSDAANKTYVDNAATTVDTRVTTEVATLNTSIGNKYDKSGGVITGDVTLNTQLHLKGGANAVTVKANAASANYVLTLPTSAGTSGYVLQTDGAGVLSWVNPSSVATGAGTVNSNSITDGSIVDADINASASIAQSKISNLTTDLAGKEATIAAGTSAQYYRGDKTFVDLGADVRGTLLTGYAVGTNTALTATDTTLDAFQNIQGQINATNTALTGKEPTIAAGTTAQYYRGDKTWATFATDAINSVLSSFAVGVGTKPAVTNTDTVVGAFGKVQKTLNDINADYVSKSADQTISGNLKINSLTGFITVPDPLTGKDAANKDYVDGFGQWTKNSSDIYRSGGNVGIGLSNPSVPLEVNGRSKISTALANVFSVIGKGTTYSDATDAIATIYSENTSGPGGNVLKVSSAYAPNSFVVKDNGYVGVGILSPLSVLHVKNAVPTGGLPATSGTAEPNLWTRIEANAAILDQGFISSGSAWIQPRDRNNLATNYNLLLNPNGGNVGIGATNPNAKLQLNTTQAVDGIFIAGNSNQNLGINTNNGAGSSNSLTQAGDRTIIYSGAAIDAPGGGLVLGPWASSAKGIRLDSNGNVGIGISTPSYRLNVKDHMGITASGAGNYPQMVLRNESKTGANVALNWVLYNMAAPGYSNGLEFWAYDSSGCTGGLCTANFKMFDDGNAWVRGTLAQASDKRLKKNIVKLNSSLEKLLSLDGVYYHWISPAQDQERQIGLIAQNVQKVFPEVVKKNADGFLSVNYISLVAPIIESIKEISQKVLGNEKSIQENHRAIASIKAETRDEIEKKDQEIKELKNQNYLMKKYLCAKDPKAPFCLSK